MTNSAYQRNELVRSLQELRTELLPNILSSSLIISSSGSFSTISPDVIQRSKIRLNALIEKAILIINDLYEYLLLLKRNSILNYKSINEKKNLRCDQLSSFYRNNSEDLEKRRLVLICEIEDIVSSNKQQLDSPILNLFLKYKL